MQLWFCSNFSLHAIKNYRFGRCFFFCHVTSLEFTLGLFCQTPLGFPCIWQRDILPHTMWWRLFMAKTWCSPCQWWQQFITATCRTWDVSNIQSSMTFPSLQYPMFGTLFHWTMDFFQNRSTGEGEYCTPTARFELLSTAKASEGALAARESRSSVPRFHIYGMLFFHIRPIAYCINNIYIYKYTYVII